MDFENDTNDMVDVDPGPVNSDPRRPAPPESTRALVKEICERVRDDKKHHKRAFERMRRDMRAAMTGAVENWAESNYKANLLGRHVKMKTAALYAKNPKATAKRRETMDFAVWDENPASLQLAYQTVQQAQIVLQQQTSALQAADPLGLSPPAPALPPGVAEAQAVLADFQQGFMRRTKLAKFGKTLEIVFAHQLREQKPLDFKRGMKALVRRALTTCVGYVELDFQREYGPRAAASAELMDAQGRLDHLRSLVQKANDGEITSADAEIAELQALVKSLTEEPEIVIRQGLVVDYPGSLAVIPDRLTKQLEGFVGARWVTIEYMYTAQQVLEKFNVDVAGKHKEYVVVSGTKNTYGSDDISDNSYEWSSDKSKKDNLVCVWKHYDKISGLVYFVADGHDDFLVEPAAPNVFVETFWPVYALTFNQVESEEHLYPPSDVSLLIDMQAEWNRSRQGKREHRRAARPRWGVAKGVLDRDDVGILSASKPFDAVLLNIDPQMRLSDVFQPLPVPGVDPNLYDTNEIMSDMQLVAGAQEAQFGGVSKATATESAIAANATTSSDGSAIDDLDGFLTALARDAGQILKREMTADRVARIAGPGAVWLEQSDSDLFEEVDLEVEAGSTGKPNKAVELENWSRLLPMVMQMPGLDPIWLLRETLRRMDDRMDLTDAIAAGIPSIASQNIASRGSAGAPGTEIGAAPNAPDQQGAQGVDNAPRPQQQDGSTAAFGSNQV